MWTGSTEALLHTEPVSTGEITGTIKRSMLTMDSIPNIIIKQKNLFKVRHIKIIPFMKRVCGRLVTDFLFLSS